MENTPQITGTADAFIDDFEFTCDSLRKKLVYFKHIYIFVKAENFTISFLFSSIRFLEYWRPLPDILHSHMQNPILHIFQVDTL